MYSLCMVNSSSLISCQSLRGIGDVYCMLWACSFGPQTWVCKKWTLLFYNRISHSTYSTSWWKLNLYQFKVNPMNSVFFFPQIKFSSVLRPSNLLSKVAHVEGVVFLWKPCICSIVSTGLVVLIAWALPPLGFSCKAQISTLKVTQQHLMVLLATALLISLMHRVYLSWGRLS